MNHWCRLAAQAAGLLLIAGGFCPLPDDAVYGRPCDDDVDCPGAYQCQAGACAPRAGGGADAGPARDGGVRDGGADTGPDAGSDAGVGSCADRCGDLAPGACACDVDCVTRGDCCADFADVCPAVCTGMPQDGDTVCASDFVHCAVRTKTTCGDACGALGAVCVASQSPATCGAAGPETGCVHTDQSQVCTCAPGDDVDGDGVADEVDLCPQTFDPSNADDNEDGQGDACYCFDADGDEYGVGPGCRGPDCSDIDANVYTFVIVQNDTDGDGFGAGTFTNLCVGDTLPAGYADADLDDDCDDMDPDIYPGAPEFCDNINRDCLPPAGECDCVEVTLEGVLHQFCPETRNRNQARNRCQSWGGGLARIDSLAQQDAVLAFLEATYPAFMDTWWLGLNDEGFANEGQYEWQSGVPPVYEHWAPGEPNDPLVGGAEDCVELLRSEDGGWNDVNCATENRYICTQIF